MPFFEIVEVPVSFLNDEDGTFTIHQRKGGVVELTEERAALAQGGRLRQLGVEPRGDEVEGGGPDEGVVAGARPANGEQATLVPQSGEQTPVPETADTKEPEAKGNDVAATDQGISQASGNPAGGPVGGIPAVEVSKRAARR